MVYPPVKLRYSIFCLGFFFCMLLIQCSDSRLKKPDKVSRIKENKTKILAESDIIKTPEVTITDSLKILLESISNDTARLNILDKLANLATDDSLVAVYNDEIETLLNKILNDSPGEDVKIKNSRFQASLLHRKGNISINQYDFTKAREYFNQSLKLSEETENRKEIAKTYISLGNTYYYESDYQTAIHYYEKSLTLSESLGDKTNMSRALNNLGIMYADLENIQMAREYYLRNLKIQEDLREMGSIANTLNNIGVTYSDQGDMQTALEYYHRSLKISEEINDKKGISYALSNIGIIYEYEKDFPAALEYYFRSLKIQEDLGDKNLTAAALNNIANVYIDLADDRGKNNVRERDSLTSKALEYYFQSLAISEEIGDLETITETLLNIGQTYDEQSELIFRSDSILSRSLAAKALQYFNRSLHLSEEIDNKSSISYALVQLGNIYLRENRTGEALKCAKRAYRVAKETGYTFNIRDASQLLDKIYLKLNDYRSSRRYYGEYTTMRDSIIKDENQQLVQKKYYQYQYQKKAATDSIAHSKEMKISKLEIEKRKVESRRQRLVIGFVVIGLLLVLFFALYIFRSLRITRRQKLIIETQKLEVESKNIKLSEQNEEIISQRDEIEAQRDMVLEQKQYIENIHYELTGSIRYAERIQKAVLPSDDYITGIINECRIPRENLFILYKPRDIVSGDFYFFESRNGTLYIAVADCTGHGVPGALMSMLGISFLNEIMAKDLFQTPFEIVNELRKNIIHSLQQKGIEGEQKDGLDLAFVSYEMNTGLIQYAGANSPLYIVRPGSKELTVIQADTMPVAIFDRMDPFTNHEIRVRKGDIIYLSSDGYGDQFGGPKERKFMVKKFKELLAEISDKPMDEQHHILDKTIEAWKMSNGVRLSQTDDITVIGLKIK